MEKEDMIPAETFCNSHQVEISFIRLLQENGLIQMVTVEEKGFIPTEQLPELERFLRLHYELEINIEGIEAINHLLTRLEHMQQDITALKNKLRFYETE